MTESIRIEGRWIIYNKSDRDFRFEFSGMLLIRPGNKAVLIPDYDISDDFLTIFHYVKSGKVSDECNYSGNITAEFSGMKNIPDIPLITGKGVSGSDITLTENHFLTGISSDGINLSGNTGDENNGIIVPGIVIDGFRFENCDEITFCTMILFPDDFINWTKYDIYRKDFFKEYEEILIYSSDYFNLSISSFDLSGDKNSATYNNAALIVRYPKEKKMNEITDDLKIIQIFLSFMMDKPSFYWYIKGIHEREPLLSDYAGRKITDICSIYFSDSMLTNRKLIDYSGYGKFIVGFEEIKDNSGIYFSGWLNFFKNYESLTGLYFSVVFNPEMYRENKFLAFVECLEIYHRKSGNFRNYLIEPGEYEERINTVKKVLGENKIFTKKIRESIVNTLKFGNKPNLENRLNDLCYFFRDYLILYIDDYENFSSDVSVNRNYIVHREAKKGFSYADGFELEKLVVLLELLIHLIFLYEAGFDAEFIHRYPEKFIRMRYNKVNQHKR